MRAFSTSLRARFTSLASRLVLAAARAAFRMSSERLAYQISKVPIPANPAIASR